LVVPPLPPPKKNRNRVDTEFETRPSLGIRPYRQPERPVPTMTTAMNKPGGPPWLVGSGKPGRGASYYCGRHGVARMTAAMDKQSNIGPAAGAPLRWVGLIALSIVTDKIHSSYVAHRITTAVQQPRQLSPYPHNANTTVDLIHCRNDTRFSFQLTATHLCPNSISQTWSATCTKRVTNFVSHVSQSGLIFIKSPILRN